MSAHTPGPWSAEPTDTDGHVLVVDEQDVSVCRVYQQPHDTWQAADTAALIAAAPDLLAALRSADAWVAQYHGTPGHDAAAQSMSRVIRAAIARATGGAV